MKYSEIKYVKPSVDGENITKGKVYSFELDYHKGGYIKNDLGDRIYIFIPRCYYINDSHWIPCDETGNEIKIY